MEWELNYYLNLNTDIQKKYIKYIDIINAYKNKTIINEDKVEKKIKLIETDYQEKLMLIKSYNFLPI